MSVSFVILLSVLSSIAHRGSKVLVSLDALHLGANSFMVGVLAALYAVFPLLLAVYAGRISDRIGVRYPIMLGSVGITAGLFLPALHEGLFTLFLCPTLIGLGQIFFHVSIHNAVGSIGDPADRVKNFSSFSLGQSVATFIGPSLAGFTIDTLGFRPTFVVLAVISLAVVLPAFLLGLGLGSAQPLTIMLTYHHAPAGRSGEALGMRLTVNKITQISIPLVFGGIGAVFGLAPVFWANAAFLLAGGIVSVKDLREGRGSSVSRARDTRGSDPRKER